MLSILQPQCFGHPFPVGGVCKEAVAHMTFFDKLFAAGHGAGGVFKQQLLFFRGHKAEEGSRL